MIKYRVGLGKKKRARRREERGERGGMNKREQFRNIKCCISKNGDANSNQILKTLIKIIIKQTIK